MQNTLNPSVLTITTTDRIRYRTEALVRELDARHGSTTETEWSSLDASVNFVVRGRGVGMSEARFVQRSSDEVIVYLSSQTGCRQACRFCHLTQSGQTALENESLVDYVQQADLVLGYYDILVDEGAPGDSHNVSATAPLGQLESSGIDRLIYQPAQLVNFNFMSRGELLANPEVLTHGDRLLGLLGDRARESGLYPRFKCSTIMPADMADLELADVFTRTLPDIYYSLYSVDPAWRRRWMPRAIDPELALAKLARWQSWTRKIPVVHWALIEGGASGVEDNGSEASVVAIIEAVRRSGLRPDVNIVRYNPANDRLGKEPSAEVLERAASQLANGLPGARIQIVGRVGHDVKASCGMFYPAPDSKRPQGLQGLPVLSSTPSRFIK